MSELNIRDYICRELSLSTQDVALDFVSYLENNNMTFIKDNGSYWKHINYCKQCGSCSGGKSKMVFGKVFDDVCGCTFRIDNPTSEDLPFLKEMVQTRKKEILNAGR